MTARLAEVDKQIGAIDKRIDAAAVLSEGVGYLKFELELLGIKSL